MSDKPEEYSEFVERLAYTFVRGIARGTPAIELAGLAASQTLMWRRETERYESKLSEKAKP